METCLYCNGGKTTGRIIGQELVHWCAKCGSLMFGGSYVAPFISSKRLTEEEDELGMRTLRRDERFRPESGFQVLRTKE